MTRRIFHYNGDVNIENGGFFYCLDTWADGYVDVVRVDPCSDAGGPDNCFWVEKLTVNLEEPDSQKWHAAMDCIGYCDTPSMWQDYVSRTAAEKRHIQLAAHVAYGLFDVHEYSRDLSKKTPCTIRVGPPDPAYRGDKFEPDVILRANANLYNYARRICNEL